MKTIWKYPLEIEDQQEITVPYGAKILSVIEQNNQPVLYALVNSESARLMDMISILIRGTGHPIEERDLLGHDFVGTISTYDGRLIWHIFVEKGAKCRK